MYLDSSAIVKLVVREAESDALLALLSGWPDRISSALARTEVIRAVRRAGVPGGARRAAAVLARIALVRIDDEVLRAAAGLPPTTLRTLDAIHVATAVSVGAEIGALVTYDAGMRHAASLARVKTLSPGRD